MQHIDFQMMHMHNSLIIIYNWDFQPFMPQQNYYLKTIANVIGYIQLVYIFIYKWLSV